MKAPLDVIKDFGCRTDSYIAAIQYLTQQDVDKTEYEHRIQEIIGMSERPVYNTWYEARCLFLYVVQETIRQFSAGVSATISPTLMEDIYDIAVQHTHEYITNNSWNETTFNISHGIYIDKDQLIGNENNTALVFTHVKKGAKKDICEQLFKTLKTTGATRQEIIDAFVKQAVLSHAGATTYFHSLKKQFGFSDKQHDQLLTQKAETKQQQAQRLYDECVDKSKATIIDLFVEKLPTSRKGAQTYYYLCRNFYEDKESKKTTA